jgi:hypothetical protein
MPCSRCFHLLTSAGAHFHSFGGNNSTLEKCDSESFRRSKRIPRTRSVRGIRDGVLARQAANAKGKKEAFFGPDRPLIGPFKALYTG